MKTGRSLIPGIAALLMLGALSACTPGGGESSPATPGDAQQEPAAIINIENDTASEIEAIIRMNLDGAVLPTIDGVTTAADNSELAPVYLKVGDQHEVVRKLQERLMSLGFMDNDEPTNYYGEATSEAVKHFQRQLDMTEDGICGTETWDALFSSGAP